MSTKAQAGKVAIIVSAGRTGTRFLARYFDANHPEVVARHEPRPRYLLRVCSNAYNAGRLSRERMRDVLRWTRGRGRQQSTAPVYVEANPYLHGFVEVLDAVWPDPLVVHVVRDPRSYVRSVLNHGNARGLKKLANQWIPYWIPDVKGTLGLAREPSPVGLFAGQWRIINESLERRGARLPRYQRFSFEELFEPPYAGLERLCRLLDLEFPGKEATLPPTRRINPSRDRVIGPWSTWAAPVCAELHGICSPLMQRYGYGNEGPWLERVNVQDP